MLYHFFMIGINELINEGYNTMILNVLNGNNTIKFYEKYCGKKVGEKQDSFDDTILTEIIMYFEDLEDIYSKYNSKNANTIAKKKLRYTDVMICHMSWKLYIFF